MNEKLFTNIILLILSILSILYILHNCTDYMELFINYFCVSVVMATINEFLFSDNTD